MSPSPHDPGVTQQHYRVFQIEIREYRRITACNCTVSWDLQARTKGRVRGQGCLGRNECAFVWRGKEREIRGQSCKEVSGSILIWPWLVHDQYTLSCLTKHLLLQ